VAVAIKNKTRTDHNEMPGSFYNFNVKPHLNSFNYPELRQTTFNVVNMGKQFVVFLNHPGFWPTVELSRATTLVLSNNFKLSRRDLEQMKQLKTLVVDGSNNNYTAARTEELSRNFGVNFYNTRYKGAYLLTLQ